MELQNRILSGDAVIGVIGLGYVGIPLAMEFCKGGYRVIGFDIDTQKTQMLEQRRSYVLDVPSEVVADAIIRQRFIATADFDRLYEVDAVSICFPTPLRKSKEPDVSNIVAAVDQLRARLHAPCLSFGQHDLSGHHGGAGAGRGGESRLPSRHRHILVLLARAG